MLVRGRSRVMRRGFVDADAPSRNDVEAPYVIVVRRHLVDPVGAVVDAVNRGYDGRHADTGHDEHVGANVALAVRGGTRAGALDSPRRDVGLEIAGHGQWGGERAPMEDG